MSRIDDLTICKLVDLPVPIAKLHFDREVLPEIRLSHDTTLKGRDEVVVPENVRVSVYWPVVSHAQQTAARMNCSAEDAQRLAMMITDAIKGAIGPDAVRFRSVYGAFVVARPVAEALCLWWQTPSCHEKSLKNVLKAMFPRKKGLAPLPDEQQDERGAHRCGLCGWIGSGSCPNCVTIDTRKPPSYPPRSYGPQYRPRKKAARR
jgi:rubrerythrin